MITDPLVLLDPELVVPNGEQLNSLGFWSRLNDWASDPTPRLGASVMSALQVLLGKPPQVVGLPQGDFWKIVSKVMSRGIQGGSPGREVCENHLRRDYTPFMGDKSNFDRLAADLKSISPQQPIVLATATEAWKIDQSQCDACVKDRISRTYEPALLGEIAPAVSVAWRDEYLSAAARDLEGIEILADRMFPNLTFADGAWSKLGTLVGDVGENVRGVVEHLGVLSDHAYLIWDDEKNTNERQAVLRSLGVMASPESAQTHKNQSAMRERDFNFNGRVLRCEWHTKLRATVNRIHFRVDQDGVYVGLITRHLTV